MKATMVEDRVGIESTCTANISEPRGAMAEGDGTYKFEERQSYKMNGVSRVLCPVTEG